MISIDFQGGTHGNYLQFVCNIMGGVRSQGLPFNELGAAHNKKYIDQQLFISNHYTTMSIPFPIGVNQIISIQITEDDLLPLQQISLLRAGNHGYDSDTLEVNTYNKLNNTNYRWVLDQLVDGFFKNQIKQSYDAVKDPNWPRVNTRSDYLQLPLWIQDECKNVHNLYLLEFNEQTPDCPRHILREFFQIGFKNPQQHGFMSSQKLMSYPEDFDVFVFPFCCFYDTKNFLDQIKKVAQWAGLSYKYEQEIVELHKEFFKRQPYRNSKIKCDSIVKQLIINKDTELPKLDLLEQAYVNAKLGRNYFI